MRWTEVPTSNAADLGEVAVVKDESGASAREGVDEHPQLRVSCEDTINAK